MIITPGLFQITHRVNGGTFKKPSTFLASNFRGWTKESISFIAHATSPGSKIRQEVFFVGAYQKNREVISIPQISCEPPLKTSVIKHLNVK